MTLLWTVRYREENKSQIDIQLFSWFPYTSPTRCDKLKEAVLLDRWNSDGEFVLKANLFPEKVPKTFHKCSTKLISFIFPPAVMQNSEKHYTGLEVNFIELIFERLNLTAEFNVSPNTRNSFHPLFTESIQQLEPSSSDITIGGLPFHASIIGIVEATIPYFYVRVSWYVPCPIPASRWKSIYKIFGPLVWACFTGVAILAVIVMRLLAHYGTQIHVRESSNYNTIIYCIYNLLAVISGVPVPQKPISHSLRIFFTAWVWYSVAMGTVYQAYFIGHLVNPGFEKSITTVNELLESGIEYGYPGGGGLNFSDPTFDIIKKNRKTCKTIYKCLQRVIERKDFATIFDSFHEQYFRTKLFFHNIEVPVCTIPEDIFLFRVSTYMAKGNPLLYRFNEIITRIFESGLFEKWQNEFLFVSKLDDHPIDDDDTKFSDFTTNELNTDYSPFSLLHLRVVFQTLVIGQIINTFVLLVELLCYRARITVATSTTV